MEYKRLLLITVAIVFLSSVIAVSSDVASADTGTVTVVYDPNGGDGDPIVKTYENATSYQIIEDAPVRDGYAFLGWSLNPSSSVADYWFGKTVPIDSTTTETTYYAVWKLIPADDGDMDLIYSIVPVLCALSVLLAVAWVIVKRRKEENE